MVDGVPEQRRGAMHAAAVTEGMRRRFAAWKHRPCGQSMRERGLLRRHAVKMWLLTPAPFPEPPQGSRMGMSSVVMSVPGSQDC